VTIYLDSSVLLRYLLSGDEAIRAIPKSDSVLSSELLEIECKRVMQRERLEGNMDDAHYAAVIGTLERVLDMMTIVALGPEIRRRAAESFPTVIGTLDALHLATARAYRERFPEPLAMLSYDKQLSLCASASGIPSYRP
jgi:predicted nucleic acid-binding protein